MAAIKLSAPDWCFYKQQCAPEAYYQALRDMGITGVEMASDSRWAIVHDTGLPLLNLSGPGMTKGLNRLEHHAELLPQIREKIALAAANNISAVIVFSGNREGQADKIGQANVIIGLKALAPEAERAGVTLLFEMLNSYEHTDYQGDSSAYGFGVVRGVDSPAVKALYDIYHLQRMGEDVLNDIRQNLDIIAHLHLAESPHRTAPVPGGQIDYAAIVPAVLDAGYQGFWGLEYLPQGDILAELAQSVQFMQACAGVKIG